MADLQKEGIVCFYPIPEAIRDQKEPSKFVKGFSREEQIKVGRVGTLRHFERIKKADITYLYNPKGYVGLGLAMEVGFAQALGKPIYALARLLDHAVAGLVWGVIGKKELVKIAKEEKKSPLSRPGAARWLSCQSRRLDR